MNKFIGFLFVLCSISTTQIFSQGANNMGTDFWTGYGYDVVMRVTDTKSHNYGLQLFIAAGNQAATVTIEMPGVNSIFFPVTYYIPADSIKIVTGFPVGDTTNVKNLSNQPDCRLYYTGISNRGIHIYSNNGAPIACWIYNYTTDNSAASSLLIPTNNWDSSYVVQTYGNSTTNIGIPNSFFYVIADSDSTQVTFIPSNKIIDSASSPILSGKGGGNIKYLKDTSYQVTLNKGQIFNALGYVDTTGVSIIGYGGIGVDLSGSKIKTNNSKKIAVFGGNGRCIINSSNCSSSAGSDALIQQMLPKSAWGLEYLTIPTKTMADNVYRIYVNDTNANVKLNNALLPKSSLINKTYYQFDSYIPNKIESNLPISVNQFITSSGCHNDSVGNNGEGDVEMISLSPVNQGITDATLYCTNFKNGQDSLGGSYINVIIKKSGINSFSIDGSATVDTGTNNFTGIYNKNSGQIPVTNAFSVHPQDSSYAYAILHVSFPATHHISSNIPFNSITYGVTNAESYGYNVGFNPPVNTTPVILERFVAELIPKNNLVNTVLLDWTTSSEINNSYFIIQYSTDCNSFTNIDTVKAIGSGANRYSFTDNKPTSGINYYRLQSIDKDGSSNYSNVVSINFGDKQSFSIIPNPAKDFATISFSKAVDKAIIEVYDITGKQVITKSLSGSSISCRLNTQSLKSGLYVIKVNTATGNYNDKLLINK